MKIALAIMVTAILGFLYLPIVVLIVFSFNDNYVTTLPLKGFTLGWYEKLLANEDMLAAVKNSLYVAFTATVLTLVIGTPAAFALDRATFPGKSLFRRLIVLPLTLPGIITGISMLNLFGVMGCAGAVSNNSRICPFENILDQGPIARRINFPYESRSHTRRGAWESRADKPQSSYMF